MHCSRRRLLRRGLEFDVVTINKSAHTKKAGNLFNDPRISNIYDLVGLGWVLRHINHCRLSNAKSSLYIYISNIYQIYMIWFDWVLWHIKHCWLYIKYIHIY